MPGTRTDTLFDAQELLKEMRDHLRYWNDLYREPCETREKVMRNNCRVALAACIQTLEDEFEAYEAQYTAQSPQDLASSEDPRADTGAFHGGRD